MTGPLEDLRVVELDCGLATMFAARLFADLGADVVRLEDRGQGDDPLHSALNLRKRIVRINRKLTFGSRPGRFMGEADLLITGSTAHGQFPLGIRPEEFRDALPQLCVTSITPFGLTGPHAKFLGGDLTVFHGSAVSRFLLGPVSDPERTPPVRAYGDQTAFVAGLTAALGSLAAVYSARTGGPARLTDVSMQEAMLSLIPAQLAQHAFGEGVANRRRVLDGGASTVCALPASDGYVAISPREEHQWAAWLGVMGKPAWGTDPRFASRAARQENWDALYDLMRTWSIAHAKDRIVAMAQQAHVPCFPWELPGAHLDSPQLQHRQFWEECALPGYGKLRVPGSPYGLRAALPGASGAVELGDPAAVAWKQRTDPPAVASQPALPLEGVKVVDLGWVIAGPACTRYLAALGAEVIKVEAPGRPDPGRAGRLHEVLGQSKHAVTLDLKDAADAARMHRLIAGSDLLVENFAHGVMDRLGLGRAALHELNPSLIQVSSSGMGRNGPQAGAVAYGTLLQAYTGFSALNGYPGQQPAIGMAWTDFLCGMALAFGSIALLNQRRRVGRVDHIDLSMLETQLMTMPVAVIDGQTSNAPPAAAGNRHAYQSPHDVYRCRGDDRWLAIEIASEAQWRALCAEIHAPDGWQSWNESERRANRAEIDRAIEGWTSTRNDLRAMRELQAVGVPACAALAVADLFEDPHLKERGAFVDFDDGRTPRLPGMPWRWEGVKFRIFRAPGTGEHNLLLAGTDEGRSHASESARQP